MIVGQRLRDSQRLRLVKLLLHAGHIFVCDAYLFCVIDSVYHITQFSPCNTRFFCYTTCIIFFFNSMKYSLLSILMLVALAGCSAAPTTDDTNSSLPTEEVISSEMNAVSSVAMEQSSSEAVSSEAMADYVGMTVVDAEAMAKANNVPFRTVKEDGMDLAVTMDYVSGRINATVEAGKVVSYTVEGNEQ